MNVVRGGGLDMACPGSPEAMLPYGLQLFFHVEEVVVCRFLLSLLKTAGGSQGIGIRAAAIFIIDYSTDYFLLLYYILLFLILSIKCQKSYDSPQSEVMYLNS